MATTKQARTTKPATKAAVPAKASKATKAAAPAPVAPAPAVALRGGPAVARVALTGKAYRTGAKHNADWWQQVQTLCAQDDGTGRADAPVAALLEAGVPSHFIGYTLRRGYLAAA
jgi:hypothetical protein